MTPLLTIAIPTFNRAAYLAENLVQLQKEAARFGDRIELIVSDNCSTDETAAVVRDHQSAPVPVRYIRNAENVGWARNFAQCVELANGKYLLLLGDDDLLCDGTLDVLVAEISKGEVGVVCIQPFGYDESAGGERPAARLTVREFVDNQRYIPAISQYFTLTSALVMNRDMLRAVDPRQFIETNIATFHLVLRAALAAQRNVYIGGFLLASKRNNSAPYRFADIFVTEFWDIVDAHAIHGLAPATIRHLERQRLFTYYPGYMLDIRKNAPADVRVTLDALDRRFGRQPLYRLWLRPILTLPHAPALFWGTFAMAVGRLARGDLKRGIALWRSKLLLRGRG